MPSADAIVQKPRVVIVGGGFGGLEVAKRLRRVPVDVTLIDRHNYHLFQPLLYQVATGGLSPANVATPLRSILRRNRNCTVLMAEVRGIDPQKRWVELDDGGISYDFLVVAAGSTHSYFGNDQWREHAPGLKSIEDAASMRRKIYLAFEAAEREDDPALRQQWMTFVVVGGGPTGVELAGAIAEIALYTLKYDFRRIDSDDARILLVETGQYVLSSYCEKLSRNAEQELKARDIDVRTRTTVVDVAKDHVRLSSGDVEERIPTRTVVWGAGVQAVPLAKQLAQASAIEPDRGGRLPVTEQLNIDRISNVFVIGDMARCLDAEGNPLPGQAPVAIQQGRFVAKLIRRQVAGKAFSEHFRYKDRGMMATIGRAAAIAEVGRFKLSGFIAWFLWLTVHLLLIVQFQNRILILVQWAWNYLTFSRSARLILGEKSVRQPNRMIVEPRQETSAVTEDQKKGDQLKTGRPG